MFVVRRLISASCYHLAERGRSLRPGPLLCQKSWFQVVEIYNFGILCRVSACIIRQALFPRSFPQVSLGQITSFRQRVLHWTEFLSNVNKSVLSQISALATHFSEFLPASYLKWCIVLFNRDITMWYIVFICWIFVSRNSTKLSSFRCYRSKWQSSRSSKRALVFL